MPFLIAVPADVVTPVETVDSDNIRIVRDTEGAPIGTGKVIGVVVGKGDDSSGYITVAV